MFTCGSSSRKKLHVNEKEKKTDSLLYWRKESCIKTIHEHVQQQQNYFLHTHIVIVFNDNSKKELFLFLG